MLEFSGNLPEGLPPRLRDAPSSMEAFWQRLRAPEETAAERVLVVRAQAAQTIQVGWRYWRDGSGRRRHGAAHTREHRDGASLVIPSAPSVVAPSNSGTKT